MKDREMKPFKLTVCACFGEDGHKLLLDTPKDFARKMQFHVGQTLTLSELIAFEKEWKQPEPKTSTSDSENLMRRIVDQSIAYDPSIAKNQTSRTAD